MYDDNELETIFNNPKAYGLPTFDEFAHKPEILLGRDDEQLASVANGTKFVREIYKHVYFLEGYRCDSLEDVERMAGNMGIAIKDLDWIPELRSAQNGKYINEIRFFHKSNMSRRKDWR
jgi:hypothetical protein